MEKQLELVNEWKLLGVIIDQHLDWKSHIDKITKECYTMLLVLKKLKGCVRYIFANLFYKSTEEHL